MLMRAIIGFIRPSSGTVLINDKILSKDTEFPESIGFLLETPSFLDRYSGFNNLKILADIKRAVVKEYNEHEVVPFDSDFNDNSGGRPDGYTLEVMDKEFLLAYAVDSDICSNYKRLPETKPRLQLTEYPNRKMIKLK